MFFSSVKVLIATIGLSLGSAAIAEDLVYYGTGASRKIYYYDAETIRRYSNNTVEVWEKRDASKDKTVPFRTARNKVRFNCSAETHGYLSIVTYRANGTVIHSGSNEYPTMDPMPPGTIMDSLFKILCPGQ